MVKKKQKNPPIFSHEFVIQNHPDILAVLLMFVFVGMMLEATKEFSKIFYEFQYGFENSTDSRNFKTQFEKGGLDILSILFQSIVFIIIQSIIQDYLLDKYSKRYHLSKTKHSRFNESAHLLSWFLSSTFYAVHIIMNENFLDDLKSLTSLAPSAVMTWHAKAYMLAQIAYWIHMFPELYFQKVRKDEIPFRVRYYTIHLVFMLGAYVFSVWKLALILSTLHYISEACFHFSRLMYFAGKKNLSQNGFNIWSKLFPLVRVVTIGLAVVVYFFAIPQAQNDSSAPPCSTCFFTRLLSFSSLCLLQVWLFLSYINLQKRLKREEEAIKKANAAAKNAKLQSKKLAAAKKQNSEKAKSQ